MSPAFTESLEQDIEEAITAMVARHAVVVPPYPAVALKLGELVKRESYGLAEVVRLVEGDPTLAADLLRCANSSFFARGAEVTSLAQAASRIGAEEVVRLAVASSLGKAAQAAGPFQTLRRLAWQSSVASALLCQELAVVRGLPGETAFLCGLLHDYGRLIALATLEDIVAAMPEVGARPASWWTELVERAHVGLGRLLVGRWCLPSLFDDIIAFHHADSTTWDSPDIALIQVVVTVDRILEVVRAKGQVDAESLRAVPRLSNVERSRMVQAIPSIPGVIASFEREMRESPPESVVAVAEPTLPDGFRRIDMPVVQTKPKARRPFTMHGISLEGWVMTGVESIGVNSLIEVRIERPGEPITLWGHVMSCVADGSQFRLECRPFATGRVASEQMLGLFRGADATRVCSR